MMVKDFQFANIFLTEELGLSYDPELCVNIIWDDKTDSVTRSGTTIEIHNPTSVTKTLFNLISKLVEDEIENPYKQDLFSLVLHQAVYDYVYREKNECKDNPPALISGNKTSLPTLIIREIVEPLIDKKIDLLYLLYNHCPFTDSCRIINSYMEMEYCKNINSLVIPNTRYPFIFVNCSINNRASVLSHILIRQLEQSLGEVVTQKLLKKLVLNEEEGILGYIIKIMFMVEQDPLFVDDFLLCLKAYTSLNEEDSLAFVTIVQSEYNRWPGMRKYAQKYTPQIGNQWSSFLGLIEKQLDGFRGSKMETTELMKEVDDTRRKLRNKKRKAKGKKDLNFEDLLEVYREQYATELAEPGTLHERLLQKNRIW